MTVTPILVLFVCIVLLCSLRHWRTWCMYLKPWLYYYI